MDEADRGGRRDDHVLGSGDRVLRAGTVIVATGPMMAPRVPGFAEQLDSAIEAPHSADYRNPAPLPDGAVLSRPS